ncbi:MAG: EAL domain-containing protein [Polaromonas sp.]|uniref:putative bifunctional diguanylate cyclase/phosphodiesterase n=1 Tax=Burkholderiales TaxID=80840 RepID=UPI002488C49B|nr:MULTISPECIES: EAL domain-containing protein [Burkholderiales]MDI1258638.1 EAL domain-containing protein [Aquabacterium sp.]MDI1270976.1 EAL domain-containing protein [Polaromonas sp.]
MNLLSSVGTDDSQEQPKVLLVDDDEVNLLLTSIALRERGFAITEASSGEQALQIISEWLPDVVVLDAVMPGLDGFATCQELRHLPGYESVPVLMLTGLDDEASITRAYEVGATDFFIKCTQWSLLAGRLRYLLRASRTRHELERSKATLARAQDLARMGSFDWRQGVTDIVFSMEGMRVFGLGGRDRLGLKRILRMIGPEERQSFERILREVLDHGTVLCNDIQVNLHDGRQRILHIEAEPEFNEVAALIGYTGIVQDVTDRRVAEDKIKHLANFDTLTGLPNRRQIFWRSERAIEHAKRLNHHVALLQIGVDRFKIINENLGHHAGDELLIEVSRRLRSCVRHSEQVMEGNMEMTGTRGHRTLEAVGRLGADEFVVLLPEIVNEAEAMDTATRILQALRDPMMAAGQECFITASIGIALFPAHGLSVADLLRNADVAMDLAKSQGRNTALVYDLQLASKGRVRLDLDTALHKALERDELVLYYQPKIDVRTSKMVGAEALMRWMRDGKIIPPIDFIPLAEATGLINAMSLWAITQAARQAKIWQKQFGFDASIAVNLPSRLFELPDLVDKIQAILTQEGVPPHFIELEITETGLMKDLQGVMPSLQRLNQMGIEISIDDFGTGYSSLAYLTTLPISELKIDRSFVHDLGTTPQSSAVVSAIIALARALGLRVIAEGVEEVSQMEVLYNLGCHICQGYLFARPMPAADIDTWLTNTEADQSLPRVALLSGDIGGSAISSTPV